MKISTQFNERRGLCKHKLMALFVTMLFGAFGIFNSSSTYAVGGERITVTIAPAISVDLLPIYPEGTFVTSSTSDTIVSVVTDYYTGYTLGISASVMNSNALINSSDDTKTLPSITTAVSEETYRTNAELNNTWGYRPSTIYNTATGETEENSNYLQAPFSTTPIILDKTNSANTEANNYNIAIGARSDAGTVPGAYENTFVIAVTVNPIPYSISYNKNTDDEVTNMPENVSSSTLDESVDIGGAPYRDGYKFIGWCDVETTTIDNVDSCSGNVYLAGSTYTIDYTGANNDLNLYAMWSIWSISDLTYMQEFKTLSSVQLNNVKSSMVLEQQYQLKDNRDEKEYYIAKLADGNIWMTQNLDHDIVTTEDFYTSDNTDISDGAFTMNYATHNTSDMVWTKTASSPQSYDPGNLCWDGAVKATPYTGTFDNATVDCNGDGVDKHMSIGNFYNWTAAVAMNNSQAYDATLQDADQSICPAGWTLPIATVVDGLLDAYEGVSEIYNSPAYLILAGGWGGQGFSEESDTGTMGVFWTRMASDGNNANGINIIYDSTVTREVQNLGRGGGNSVRCVAR